MHNLKWFCMCKVFSSPDTLCGVSDSYHWMEAIMRSCRAWQLILTSLSWKIISSDVIGCQTLAQSKATKKLLSITGKKTNQSLLANQTNDIGLTKLLFTRFFKTLATVPENSSLQYYLHSTVYIVNCYSCTSIINI